MATEVSNQTNNSKPKETKKEHKDGFMKKAGRYFKDMKSEYKKIVWPTKQQALQNTGVVLVFMAICAVIIWLLDFGFIKLFELMF